MAIELVNGFAGTNHITSAQVTNLIQGLVGTDNYVLQVGEKLEAVTVSANEIDIKDGGGVIQGKHFVIPAGDVEPCTIENGTQGTFRKDLIVIHYEKNASTSVESISLRVLKGTEAASAAAAVAPSYTTGDILSGALVAEAPLYEILLNGINIASVTKKLGEVPSSAQINADLSDKSGFLRSNMTTTVISAYSETSGAFTHNYAIPRDGFVALTGKTLGVGYVSITIGTMTIFTIISDDVNNIAEETIIPIKGGTTLTVTLNNGGFSINLFE